MLTDRILYQVDTFALMVGEHSTYVDKYNSRQAACAYTYLGTAQYLVDHYNLSMHMTTT